MLRHFVSQLGDSRYLEVHGVFEPTDEMRVLEADFRVQESFEIDA